MPPIFPARSNSPRRWLNIGVLLAVAAFDSRGYAQAPASKSQPTAQAPSVVEAPLTAADILRAVREAQGTRHDALDGQLRDDIAGLTFPFRLVSDGSLVRYEFKGPPPTAVQVRYNEDGSELVESGPEGSGKLTPANFDKHILGSDLTYEDLAFAIRVLAARRDRGQRPPSRHAPPGNCGSPRRTTARSTEARWYGWTGTAAD